MSLISAGSISLDSTFKKLLNAYEQMTRFMYLNSIYAQKGQSRILLTMITNKIFYYIHLGCQGKMSQARATAAIGRLYSRPQLRNKPNHFFKSDLFQNQVP
jgi:hypothetical protein